MNTETFRPSIDWSNELLTSTLWVMQMFVITTSCLLVVLVLLGRTTEWGRQFWRITGDYFKGTQSVPVWAMVGLLLLSAILFVRINVLLSYYSNDLLSSLQLTFQGGDAAKATGIHGFWSTMLVFAVLAVCYVVRTLLDLYVTQRFIMGWRIWLSRRFIDDWLGDFAYFRSQFSRQPIDNPDQRIQQDIDIFTAGVGSEPNNPANTSEQLLLFGAVEAVLSVFTFGAILWRLSGPLTLGGVTLERALFWIVIAYVLVATIFAFVIGRPLIRLSYMNELLNAGFRYSLVRLRDASAAVGLY
ncbi:MAG: vitamin B12/bleomycin/antimicrobial peptide transport system ATP-binding/permease protein, partial [Mycobacterium sp.]|nr:vitamin B12/bleomycin/antimicrobial peptide transport system ATP-binding/permease protein [Mycobacterium sp.]